MKLNRTTAVALGAAILVTGGGVGAASADDIKNLISSKDIKDESIQVRDLTAGAREKLQGGDGAAGVAGKDGAAGAKGETGATGAAGKDGAAGAKGATGATGATGAKGDAGSQGPKGDQGDQGAQGPKGDQGAQGPKGDNGLLGAYYSVAFYNAGNTNAGAIATVACNATTDVAISGGVQVLGLDAGANARNTPVSSSFPGRMDWTTNAPRPGRLDGWVIQFGGNAGATSDVSPEKAKIWALCVPGAQIPVEQTFTQIS